MRVTCSVLRVTGVMLFIVLCLQGLGNAADAYPAAGVVYDREQKSQIVNKGELVNEYGIRKIVSTAADGSVRLTLVFTMLKEVSAGIQFLSPVSPFISIDGAGNYAVRHYDLKIATSQEQDYLINAYAESNQLVAAFAHQLKKKGASPPVKRVHWIDVIFEKSPDGTGKTKTLTLVSQGTIPEENIRILKDYPVILRVPERTIALTLYENEAFEADKAEMETMLLERQLHVLKSAGIDVATEINGGKTVLVGFFDAGCQHCQVSKPAMESIKTNHPDTAAIHTVMVKENPELAKQLAVTTVPTYFYFYMDGNKIQGQRLKGRMTQEEFRGLLQIQEQEQRE